MDIIKKMFIRQGIASGAFVVVGIGCVIFLREISVATLFPIIAGFCMAGLTYLKYKEMSKMKRYDFTVRLVSTEKNFLATDYHFEEDTGKDIFVSSHNTLFDSKGKTLNKGYIYIITYLCDEQEEPDFDHPFVIVPVSGIVK